MNIFGRIMKKFNRLNSMFDVYLEHQMKKFVQFNMNF